MSLIYKFNIIINYVIVKIRLHKYVFDYLIYIIYLYNILKEI